jgi:hypothetical protein
MIKIYKNKKYRWRVKLMSSKEGQWQSIAGHETGQMMIDDAQVDEQGFSLALLSAWI